MKMPSPTSPVAAPREAAPLGRRVACAAIVALFPLLPALPAETGRAQTASATTGAPGLVRGAIDPLVEPEWLLERIGDEDVVVVQAVRREGEFAREHIAGARPLRFDEITWEGEEGWVVEFPAVDALVEVLRAAGIRRDSRVVIYGASMTATARTWVTFEYLGLGERAFLLNGGIEDWKAAGGAVATGDAGPVRRGDVEAGEVTDFRVSAEWILERLEEPSVVLLDARPDDEYTGADDGMGGITTPGHIPGAAQLYWEELMDPENNARFLPRERIAEILERHGAGEGRTHVAYCMIGMRASVAYMAARMHGLDIHLYDGSWRDWGMREGAPVETGPDPRDGSGPGWR